MSQLTETRWVSVSTLADYFGLGYAQVRDELQQRHLLGEINGALCATEEQASVWVVRSFGEARALDLMRGFGGLSVSISEEDVPLVEEFDASTTGDTPYLL